MKELEYLIGLRNDIDDAIESLNRSEENIKKEVIQEITDLFWKTFNEVTWSCVNNSHKYDIKELQNMEKIDFSNAEEAEQYIRKILHNVRDIYDENIMLKNQIKQLGKQPCTEGFSPTDEKTNWFKKIFGIKK